MIDIGGPAMLRAAAKNFIHVVPVCSIDRYGIDRRRAARARATSGSRRGARSRPRRSSHTAVVRGVDRAVVLRPRDLPRPADRLAREGHRPPVRREPAPARGLLRRGRRAAPPPLAGGPARRQAALVQQPERPRRGPRAPARVHRAGLRDREAREPVRRARSRPTSRRPTTKALACDPVSAYGGVVAVNRRVEAPLAEKLAEQFVEVLIAPGVHRRGDRDPAAQGGDADPPGPRAPRRDAGRARLQARARRAARPGLGHRDRRTATLMEVATGASPTSRSGATSSSPGASRSTSRSNAIVLAKGLADDRDRGGPAEPRGRGPDRARQGARARPRPDGRRARLGRVLPLRGRARSSRSTPASRAIIQPGGSKRDDEVTAAVETAGATMVLTGRRHFRTD